jgi:cytochrome c oxidase subunit IV
MENTELKIHHPGYGTYILVWLGLVAFTTLTVAIAGLNLYSLTVVVALAIATTKSLLVANYFMHVRSDSRVFKVFIAVCIVIFLTMIILTFFDLIFRYPAK